MTITKILLSQLRRSRPLLSLSHAHCSYFLTNPNLFNHQSPIPSLNSYEHQITAFHNFPNSRSFWSRSKPTSELQSESLTEPKVTGFGEDGAFEGLSNGDSAVELPTELVNGENSVGDSVVTDLVGGWNVGEESILPVRTLISLLDGFHDLTGLPWWAVISLTTLAMRLSLLPVIILQLKKLRKIAEFLPRLPPPFVPLFSGKSNIKQFLFFNRERRTIGCPSFLWFCAYVSVQIPVFLLWVTSIRRMCLNFHDGFDCGGALWFQDLTGFPHGVSGPIFPLLIAGLHYTNVQLSFKDFLAKDKPGILSLLAKYYKIYLDILTLPLFFTAYCLPQGSLVYWVTNGSLTVIQTLFLRNPAVREKLGLPDKNSPPTAVPSPPSSVQETTFMDSTEKEVKLSAEDLSPDQLYNLSFQLVAQQQIDSAIVLLRATLEKEPEFVEAMVLLGRSLLQKGELVEATEHLERAIPKLCLTGEEKDVTTWIILASQCVGVAYVRQGRIEEGILHFERVVHMGEPNDPKSKPLYFDTFIFLAGALNTVGRKPEAINYLKLATAYSPAYRKYLEQCENTCDDFGDDLINSRRRDY